MIQEPTPGGGDVSGSDVFGQWNQSPILVAETIREPKRVLLLGASPQRMGQSPQVFTCNVCHLTLTGQEELREAHLPTAPEEIQMEDLGEDFDPVLLDARRDFA